MSETNYSGHTETFLPPDYNAQSAGAKTTSPVLIYSVQKITQKLIFNAPSLLSAIKAGLNLHALELQWSLAAKCNIVFQVLSP